MEKQLMVAVSALEKPLRDRIARAAEGHGFLARFFDDEGQALLHAKEAEIVFTQSPAIARSAVNARWVCTPWAGVDQLVASGCLAGRDVILSNSSGAYGVAIAEHIVMVTLEMLRQQTVCDAFLSRREWKQDLPIRAILGSRVTFLGTGDIGKETAKRFRAFVPRWIVGVNRSGVSPSDAFDRITVEKHLDDVLPQSDILVISLPGTRETFHLLDARRLALLPDGALIVNVGRGTVVDQRALEKELIKGRLLAALDVFKQEPLPADDPLWDCPNVRITPHTAGKLNLPYTCRRIVELFLEDFENYCAGHPLKRQVDFNKGY